MVNDFFLREDSAVWQSALTRKHANMLNRILLVDDHEVVREGLANLLRDRWDVCGEAGNGLEAIEKVLELEPDLVLLDLSMPLMGGTAAARQIRRLSPKTKIVFLSMHESETVIELTRLAGADACVSKRCAVSDLHKAIAAVLQRPARTTTPRLFDPT
jgi:two-component system response regulator NreC